MRTLLETLARVIFGCKYSDALPFEMLPLSFFQKTLMKQDIMKLLSTMAENKVKVAFIYSVENALVTGAVAFIGAMFRGPPRIAVGKCKFLSGAASFGGVVKKVFEITETSQKSLSLGKC